MWQNTKNKKMSVYNEVRGLPHHTPFFIVFVGQKLRHIGHDASTISTAENSRPCIAVICTISAMTFMSGLCPVSKYSMFDNTLGSGSQLAGVCLHSGLVQPIVFSFLQYPHRTIMINDLCPHMRTAI